MAQAQKTEITEQQSILVTSNVMIGVISQLLHARKIFDETVFTQKKVICPQPPLSRPLFRLSSLHGASSPQIEATSLPSCSRRILQLATSTCACMCAYRMLDLRGELGWISLHNEKNHVKLYVRSTELKFQWNAHSQLRVCM
jgi:hypothetical protein